VIRSGPLRFSAASSEPVTFAYEANRTGIGRLSRKFQRAALHCSQLVREL